MCPKISALLAIFIGNMSRQQALSIPHNFLPLTIAGFLLRRLVCKVNICPFIKLFTINSKCVNERLKRKSLAGFCCGSHFFAIATVCRVFCFLNPCPLVIGIGEAFGLEFLELLFYCLTQWIFFRGVFHEHSQHMRIFCPNGILKSGGRFKCPAVMLYHLAPAQ